MRSMPRPARSGGRRHRSARASAPLERSTRLPPSPSAASTPATTTTVSTASMRPRGRSAWSFSTGGYVYSGPVVARTRHTGPTVYIGSFDGNIYALNARSGEPRWIRSAGGSVIGSLSAVGNIVYAAEFTNGSTNGYAMKTGRQVFHYKTGDLHAGDLRRTTHLPGRLLQHQCPAALQVQGRGRRSHQGTPAGRRKSAEHLDRAANETRSPTLQREARRRRAHPVRVSAEARAAAGPICSGSA